MGEKSFIQCQCCGCLHQVKTKDTSEDDLYIEEYCPKCRDETRHIWCGENREDVYIYYNVNVDPKYY